MKPRPDTPHRPLYMPRLRLIPSALRGVYANNPGIQYYNIDDPSHTVCSSQTLVLENVGFKSKPEDVLDILRCMVRDGLDVVSSVTEIRLCNVRRIYPSCSRWAFVRFQTTSCAAWVFEQIKQGFLAFKVSEATKRESQNHYGFAPVGPRPVNAATAIRVRPLDPAEVHYPRHIKGRSKAFICGECLNVNEAEQQYCGACHVENPMATPAVGFRENQYYAENERTEDKEMDLEEPGDDESGEMHDSVFRPDTAKMEIDSTGGGRGPPLKKRWIGSGVLNIYNF